MGALVSTMIDWLAKDEHYQRLWRRCGWTRWPSRPRVPRDDGSMFGMAIVLQVVWRSGAARAEEESGRPERCSRARCLALRWLGGHAALAAARRGGPARRDAGAAVWLGCVAVRVRDDHLGDSHEGRHSTRCRSWYCSVALAVVAFGLLPRLTVALPVTLTVVGYLADLPGPRIDWPTWVLDLSPFTHLAWVPDGSVGRHVRDRHDGARTSPWRHRNAGLPPTRRHRRLSMYYHIEQVELMSSPRQSCAQLCPRRGSRSFWAEHSAR